MKKTNSLSTFRRDYSTLVATIYTKDQINNTFLSKIARINRLYLYLINCRWKSFSSQSFTCLAIIKDGIGYIGYLEGITPEDYHQAVLIGKDWLASHNIVEIYLPVDISLWDHHRLVSPDTASGNTIGGTFYLEPANQDFYVNEFRSCGLRNYELRDCKKVATYFTAYRQNYKYIVESLSKKVHSDGYQEFSIQETHKSLLQLKIIYKVYQLSRRLFSGHQGFYDIGFLAFVFARGFLDTDQTKQQLYCIFHNTKVIGFYTSQMSMIDTKKSYIIKTIVIDPDFQKRGLTSLVIHHSHNLAQKIHADRVYYATVKSDNTVSKMDRENLIMGSEYELYSI